MTNIRSIDMLVIDDLFEMGSGYVLNFSDRTFAQFFAEELNVDIDDSAYARYGTSKARRLRCFLQTVDEPTVVRALNALWDYREAIRKRAGREDTIRNAHGQLLSVIKRLGTGAAASSQPRSAPAPAFDRELVRVGKLIGADNLMAGTDCGFAQGPFHRRVHPSIMWAKLESLVAGARLASREFS